MKSIYLSFCAVRFDVVELLIHVDIYIYTKVCIIQPLLELFVYEKFNVRSVFVAMYKK